MTPRNKPLPFFFAIFLVALLCILFACESARAPYVGKYVSEKKNDQEGPAPFIELKEKGEGTWRMADEEAPFRWNIKGKEIRLHIKPGGVIVGDIKDDEIEIELPGSKTMVFKKQRLSP